MESSGNDGFRRDEISLLAEEPIQLSVKSSTVEANGKPSLIYSIWTKKSYNQDSFKAQMKSIWKTKKKFEIQSAGQNLFLIVFELDEDLETVMEGQPWLFRKLLIIFDRLTKSIERDQIRLVSLPFWIKIGPCSPEFDKKDLLHAIGVTFGGVIRSEIIGEFCRLRIELNVQKPLRRGIFVSTGNGNKCWIPFKYEKLPTFCFGCGRVGHGLHECTELTPTEKNRIREDPPYSLALKAESYLIGRESLNLNALSKNFNHNGTTVGAEMEIKKKGEINEEKIKNSKAGEDTLKPVRRVNWRRLESRGGMRHYEAESIIQKRKLAEFLYDDYGTEQTWEGTTKRMRQDGKASRPNAMKIICWNVRGLGSPRVVRRLQFLLKQNNPQLVFLMDTKVSGKRMEEIRRKCGFMNGIDVGAVGTRGGICLEQDYPWLVSGDFNEIMYSFEKMGGQLREEKRIEEFREVLIDCQLIDVGYSRIWYTWERGNLPETNIRERLDRGVANRKWLELFPGGNINHLTSSLSDHCPLLISSTNECNLRGTPSFNFKAWWIIEESIDKEIKRAWESSNGSIFEKLERLQISLLKWVKSIKKKRKGLTKKLLKELEDLMEKDRDEDILARIIDTRIHLNMEIDKEEVY
ncbi:hypothetical protein Golob_021117 [Gossypium lobatum]|uniref:CCHC-type domain-containing protein n=1 Tax=Gossypium lobatum TaxID=34289 RepID=A0A7J8LCH9_9ROSI|nr:hypothetical protein [Gossypium lobatum]